MIDPALAGKLERIYGLLARSFLRYVVEAGRPFEEDDWDRKALEALRAWNAANLESLQRIEEVLAAERVHPLPPTYLLEFGQYHYLRASYLLRPAMRRMEECLRRLEEDAAGLEAWPAAQEEARKAIEGSRAHLEKLRALEAERPKEPPKPGAKKGVSASRW